MNLVFLTMNLNGFQSDHEKGIKLCYPNYRKEISILTSRLLKGRVFAPDYSIRIKSRFRCYPGPVMEDPHTFLHHMDTAPALTSRLFMDGREAVFLIENDHLFEASGRPIISREKIGLPRTKDELSTFR